MRKLKVLFIVSIMIFSVAFMSNAEVLDKVMVIVNEEVVTQREFDRVFEPVKKNYESSFTGEELEKRLEEVKESILEQIINTKLAVSIAKKEKISIDEAALQE